MTTELETQLNEIKALTDGWQGDGSLAPTAQTFANARGLLSLVPHDADVTPENNGTISFEWEGGHLEVGRTRFSMYTPTHYIDGIITAK